MSENNSKFDIWWSSPGVKRKVAAFYSIGASVVIVGAMFKILHLPGAAVMLGCGMTIEAILFFLGVFDKPHKEYHWENVFDFDSKGHAHHSASELAPPSAAPVAAAAPVATPVMPTASVVSDEDAKKLSEGIKNLSQTAQQFSNLSSMVGAADTFTKHIENASLVAEDYIKSQTELNSSSGILTMSYKGISENMDVVEKNTKVYAEKVDEINVALSSVNAKGVQEGMSAVETGTKKYAESIGALNKELSAINIDGLSSDLQDVQKGTKEYAAKVSDVSKNLSAINSIYELQLNTVKAHSEVLEVQSGNIKSANEVYSDLVLDIKKIKSSTDVVAEEIDKFKANSIQLSKHIADLNNVYGNMLNALN